MNNSFQNKNGNVKTFRQNDMKLSITIFRIKIVKMKGVESKQNFTILKKISILIDRKKIVKMNVNKILRFFL